MRDRWFNLEKNFAQKVNALMQTNSKPYFVYVIQNINLRYYIGISESPETRLKEHNDGISKWTRGKGPWKLIWQSAAMSITEARKLENWLKKQKGGDGFYRYTGINRDLGHNPT